MSGETVEQYREHINEAIKHNPDIIIDDGCDMVSTIHDQRPDLIDKSSVLLKKRQPELSDFKQWKTRNSWVPCGWS